MAHTFIAVQFFVLLFNFCSMEKFILIFSWYKFGLSLSICIFIILNIDQRMCRFYFVTIIFSQIDYLPFSVPVLQEADSYTIGYSNSLEFFPGQAQGEDPRAKAEKVWVYIAPAPTLTCPAFWAQAVSLHD